jgi:outer membrane protein insertion porin family
MTKAQRMSLTSLKKLLKYFIPILILSSASVFAQTPKTSYKILGITVDGNKSADANTVVANSGLKVGDEIQVPGDQTLNAIRQLWTLNIFSDIQIVVDKEISDGIFLTIKVEEYPRFERAVIEGNDDISTSDITDNINFLQGQTLRPQEMQRIKDRINALYEEDGYLNVNIDIQKFIFQSSDSTADGALVVWRNEKDPSDEHVAEYERGGQSHTRLVERIKNRILLKIKIDEGDRIVVRKIEFTGNNMFDDSDLKGEMDEIEESKWWKFWSSARFDPKKFEEDKELIINYYRKNGFRDAEIISDSLIFLIIIKIFILL